MMARLTAFSERKRGYEHYGQEHGHRESLLYLLHRSKATGKERITFTDDELERMYDAREKHYGKTPIMWSRDVHHRPAHLRRC
jgi:hypothetical protein